MKRNTIQVSIIILNFNGLDFIKPCLSTIRKQSYKNFETILADNNSTDGSVKYVKRHFPEIKIIQNKKNLGFPRGNNEAVKKTKGRYLFFLNNDTELFPDTLEKLVKAYKPHSLLSPYQIPSRDKTLQGRTGAGMDLFGFPYVNHDDLDKTKFFYADGAALFMSRKDFLDIGMFDETLFIFQEDIDLSWRAKIQGYSIIPVREARFYHYYGGTARLDIDSKRRYRTSYFRRFYNDRNAMRNVLKNYSFPVVMVIFPLLSFFYIAEMILFLFLLDFKAAMCYIKTFAWNVRNLKNTLKTRIAIQRRRKVSDWVLLKEMYWQYSKLILFLRFGLPKFQ